MIREIIIQVGDVDAAVDFYTTVCGFTHVRDVEHEDGKVVELDAGGQRVSLIPAGSPGVRLAIGSDDVAADRRRLRRRNVDIPGRAVRAPGGTWLGFTDPWGNQLGYWEETEDASSEQPE